MNNQLAPFVEHKCWNACPPPIVYQLSTQGPPCLCIRDPVQTQPAPPPPPGPTT